MEKLTLSKELVAGNTQMSNIKNNPLSVGDTVEVGSLVEASITKDSKGADLKIPVRTDFYTGRLQTGAAVKIPASEMLRMKGAGVHNENGSFTATSKFTVNAAEPRKSKDGVILFPLKYSTGFEKFLANGADWNADAIKDLRSKIPAGIDEKLAIQDYTVVSA